MARGGFLPEDLALCYQTVKTGQGLGFEIHGVESWSRASDAKWSRCHFHAGHREAEISCTTAVTLRLFSQVDLELD